MKKYYSFILLFCATFMFSQTTFELKSGETYTANKYIYKKGKYYFKSLEGKDIEVKANKIKKAVDLSLDKDRFEYNQLGLTPYVVTEVESKSNLELYNKAINWVKETYKNPDKVFKAKIEGEKIRIEGFSDMAMCIKGMLPSCYGTTYTISISFKDGKYKFEPIGIKYYVPGSKYVPAGNVSVDLNSGLAYYKKNGTYRKIFQRFPHDIELLMNSLNLSLKDYTLKSTSKKEDANDDW